MLVFFSLRKKNTKRETLSKHYKEREKGGFWWWTTQTCPCQRVIQMLSNFCLGSLGGSSFYTSTPIWKTIDRPGLYRAGPWTTNTCLWAGSRYLGGYNPVVWIVGNGGTGSIIKYAWEESSLSSSIVRGVERVADMAEIKCIGVVGAGQMGSGIAQLAVVNGVDVWLHDTEAEALSRAHNSISKNIERLVSKGHLSQVSITHISISFVVKNELSIFAFRFLKFFVENSASLCNLMLNLSGVRATLMSHS